MIVRFLSVFSILVMTCDAYSQGKSPKGTEDKDAQINEVNVTGPQKLKVVQKGSGNSVSVDQKDGKTAVRGGIGTKVVSKGGNTVVYRQSGDSTSANSVKTSQNGSGNNVTIRQSGNGNSISVTQLSDKKEKE